MTEFTRQVLRDRATALRADSRFKVDYQSSEPRCSVRRNVILNHLRRLFDTVGSIRNREALRQYFDGYLDVTPCTPDGHPTIDIFADDFSTSTSSTGNSADSTNLSKENTMNSNLKPITISTQVLINGVPAKQFTSTELYNQITQQQAVIKDLEAVDPKPQRLQADIKARKDGIKALVDYMDKVDADANGTTGGVSSGTAD